MSATLLMTRPLRVGRCGATVADRVGREQVGEVRNHTLQIRTPNIVTRRPGRGSQVVTFEVGDGDVAEFACR